MRRLPFGHATQSPGGMTATLHSLKAIRRQQEW